jgi:hypothetical protein
MDFLFGIDPTHKLVCFLELQSEQQADNEKAVCGFLESLIENNYDEYGEIYTNDVNFADWQNVQQYKNMARSVSSLQLSGILFFVVVSLALFLYSCYLNHKLRVRIPWTPYTHGQDNPVDYLDYGEAGRLSRINSGILMMRSRSPENSTRSTRDGDFVGPTGSQGDSHFA